VELVPLGRAPALDVFGLLFLYIAIIFFHWFEPLVIYVRDGFLSWDYLPLVIHISALAAIGLFLRNRRFDQIFAGWYLLVNIAWQFAARFVG
jgi:hypothetical protein